MNRLIGVFTLLAAMTAASGAALAQEQKRGPRILTTWSPRGRRRAGSRCSTARPSAAGRRTTARASGRSRTGSSTAPAPRRTCSARAAITRTSATAPRSRSPTRATRGCTSAPSRARLPQGLRGAGQQHPPRPVADRDPVRLRAREGDARPARHLVHPGGRGDRQPHQDQGQRQAGGRLRGREEHVHRRATSPSSSTTPAARSGSARSR